MGYWKDMYGERSEEFVEGLIVNRFRPNPCRAEGLAIKRLKKVRGMKISRRNKGRNRWFTPGSPHPS